MSAHHFWPLMQNGVIRVTYMILLVSIAVLDLGALDDMFRRDVLVSLLRGYVILS